MPINIFANGRAISCKSGSGQVLGGFPDVCLSPPSPPAGPIPIPYPLFSKSGDTTEGSKTVKFQKKEVMLRDKSNFKTCTGDEAATKTLGQGVITHTITGKVYFISWSMDVQVESKNVVRHLDTMTSNHASPTGDEAVPMIEIEDQTPPERPPKCQLVPYNDGCPPTADGEPQTPHHLIPDSLCRIGGGGEPVVPGVNGLTHGNGLCVCVTGQDKAATISDDKIRELGLDPNQVGRGADGVRRLNKQFLQSTAVNRGRTASLFPNWRGASPFAMTRGEHGNFHSQQDNILQARGGAKPAPYTNTVTYGEARDVAAELCERFFGCDPEDIKEQLDNHYGPMNMNEGTVLRSSDHRNCQPNQSVLGNQP